MGIFSSIQYILEDKKIYSNLQGIILFPNFYSKCMCNDRDRENSSFYSLCLYHIYTPFVFSLNRSSFITYYMNYVNPN